MITLIDNAKQWKYVPNYHLLKRLALFLLNINGVLDLLKHCGVEFLPLEMVLFKLSQLLHLNNQVNMN